MRLFDRKNGITWHCALNAFIESARGRTAKSEGPWTREDPYQR